MRESELFRLAGLFRDLQGWYDSPAGQVLFAELQSALAKLLSGLFGYYAIQVGSLSTRVDLLQNSPVGQKFHMSLDPEQGSLAASPLALPFQHDSLDLVVLLHTLDFSHDPHQVLREAHRVLISEGHLVMVGFNPFSVMGLGRLALWHTRRVPWMGHYYTSRRLRDWFSLLDFTVVQTEYVGLRPPVQNLRIQQRLKFLNQVGRYGLACLGGVRIFVAKKRVLTLTPRLSPWRPRQRVLPVNVAEPSAREASHARASRHLY